MRRLLKNMLGVAGTDSGDIDDHDLDGFEPGAGHAGFDAVLSRELIEPSVIDLEADGYPDHDHHLGHPPASGSGGRSDIEPSPDFVARRPEGHDRRVSPRHPDAIGDAVDSTAEDNRRLRAEILPGPPVATPTRAWSDHQPTNEPGPQQLLQPQLPQSQFPQSQLPQSLQQPPEPAPAPVEPAMAPVEQEVAPQPLGSPDLGDFWDGYDDAAASAELFAAPPAAVAVIIGALPAALGVARRCSDEHWVGSCDVFVLTDRDDLVEDESWTVLQRPSDVVAMLEEGTSDFPLIVLDVPGELPAWIRPLLIRLRNDGVGLVRYVLDGDPSDEDLATWHGELGRPSVLDLPGYIEPRRVIDLLDRGEPIVSVGGVPISTDLLFALRLAAR